MPQSAWQSWSWIRPRTAANSVWVAARWPHPRATAPTSTQHKYADPAQDIEVRFVREEGRAGLRFANGVVENLHPEESTRVGLTSIETMMEKMNAEMRVEQGGGRFGITLLFPLA